MPWKLALTVALLTAYAVAQEPRTNPDGDEPRPTIQTMKPLVRGTEYAVASMMPQASMTAERVLRSGGNAFDAIVAGQAVLGVVVPAMNGLGSDSVLLV